MNKDDLPPRSTPYYAKYQRDIFLAGAESGSLPEFNTDPDEVEAKAKETLSKGGWLYASSNAGQSWTHRANREAFYQWRIIPRMLVDTNQRDMSCTFKLGNQQYTFDAPIGFAPIGINNIYHPLGELNSARVAGELNLCYALSTAGSQPISEVARVHDQAFAKSGRTNKHEGGAKGRWFQLYWPHNDDLTISLLQDAHDSGYSACVLTLDTWQLAWRHGDIASANYAFYKGIGHDLGAANPVFQRMCRERGITDLQSPEAGQFWIDNVWHGRAWSWDDLPWVVQKWKEISGGKPFVLKGIQSVADAKRAAATDGIDGIVVSNHAGRQVDGAIGSLDALKDIVAAGVGEKLTIIFDSGVRTGADIFKALALGAKFVFCGRPWVYGMSVNGEAGVRHVMRSLLADFDILMNVAGFRNLDEITRDAVRHVPHASLGGAKL
ncbi:hypothetical protein JCM10908_003645 [Rhodotorula pacifica]|uniref:uncharacterized protein n=1 Tax=Rhodotorula pacifica TaxID=1495444 RepID=UPI0031821A66